MHPEINFLGHRPDVPRDHEYNKYRSTIGSLKVDQRDKPIKRNRESPSASFPVGKGRAAEVRAEKPLASLSAAPWALYDTIDS